VAEQHEMLRILVNIHDRQLRLRSISDDQASECGAHLFTIMHRCMIINPLSDEKTPVQDRLFVSRLMENALQTKDLRILKRLLQFACSVPTYFVRQFTEEEIRVTNFFSYSMTGFSQLCLFFKKEMDAQIDVVIAFKAKQEQADKAQEGKAEAKVPETAPKLIEFEQVAARNLEKG
jgi:hypothetical protein